MVYKLFNNDNGNEIIPLCYLINTLPYPSASAVTDRSSKYVHLFLFDNFGKKDDNSWWYDKHFQIEFKTLTYLILPGYFDGHNFMPVF